MTEEEIDRQGKKEERRRDCVLCTEVVCRGKKNMNILNIEREREKRLNALNQSNK